VRLAAGLDRARIRERAIARFDVERMVTAYERLYRTLVSDALTASPARPRRRARRARRHDGLGGATRRHVLAAAVRPLVGIRVEGGPTEARR
jgi:hypothetical protein